MREGGTERDRDGGSESGMKFSRAEYMVLYAESITVECDQCKYCTFFSRNSPVRGASAMSWGMGVSLPPSILNLKTRGMPLGMPTRLISSSDRLSMYFTTPEKRRKDRVVEYH